MPRSAPLKLALLPLALALLSAPAAASEAERYRLGQEMQRFAERQAWKGVERAYDQLLALGGLTARDHLLAYQAARARGEVEVAWARLELALAAEGDDDARAMALHERESLTARFGRVSIEVVPPRLDVLVAYQAPFAPEERRALDQARATLLAEHRFDGLLPVGRYMVDGEIFEVRPHGDPLALRIAPPDAATEPKDPSEPVAPTEPTEPQPPPSR